MDLKLCKYFLKWQQQTTSLALQTKDTWQLQTSKHQHKCVEEKEDEYVRGRPKEDQDEQEE